MKRLIYVIILVLLVGFIWRLYIGVNGSPIKKVQAEKDMKKYLKETYPDKDFVLGKVGYSMSFGSYRAAVTSESDSSISFMLDWRKGINGIYDEYVYKYAKDEGLSKKFADQITEDLNYILKDQIKGFKSVNSELYIKKGDYKSSDTFRKDMPEKITVWVGMFGDKISRDEFVDRCIKARELILNEGYNVEVFSLHYGTSFKGDVKGGGEELYSLALSGDLISASKEEILKSRKFYENTGKGRMIVASMLYKGVVTLFILGIISAGIFIAIKEKKQR